MSKNPIKVMSSMLSGTIIAGRVNPKTNMFIGEKDDVTDSAISAVAEHLIKEDIVIDFKIRGKKYRLQALELEEN